MTKVLRYSLYVLMCIGIFFGFVKIFDNPLSTNSANAFEWEKPTIVYFSNSKMGSSEDCTKVFPVSRVILNAETLGPGSLQALLDGVSDKEKNTGYFTSLNSGILIQKFEVKDKVAYVDFNSRFNEKVAGSCKVKAIKSQINKTLTSLPDIDSVIISVNGKTKGILEP